MNILCWNCQGLGNPWTDALRDWCWRKRPNIIFSMEMMIYSSKLERICNFCGFVNGICLSSNGRSRGMSFWWRDVNVTIGFFSTHHFIADVHDHNNVPVWGGSRSLWTARAGEETYDMRN